jgi:predicted Zn-dependent peptidase
MGHLAMSAENNVVVMLSLGKSLLDLGKVSSIDDTFKEIQMVTAEELIELANKEFDMNAMTTLTYLPNKNGVY